MLRPLSHDVTIGPFCSDSILDCDGTFEFLLSLSIILQMQPETTELGLINDSACMLPLEKVHGGLIRTRLTYSKISECIPEN